MVRPYTVGQPFRFWCQKILPLVYDDSLSYYELLNKVVDYLNKNVDNVNALGEAFNNLQKYVQDYFTNLDVQQEIDAKLDAMVEDGTMDELIQPLVGDAVSEWLEDNVTPTGSAVLVDSTLTISGAAADAKVTGDEISDLKSEIQGSVGGITTTFNVDTANLSQTFHIPLVKGIKYIFTNNTSAACTVNALKADGTIVNITQTLSTGRSIDFTPQTDEYVGFRSWIGGTGTVSVESIGVLVNTTAALNGVHANKSNLILGNTGRFEINITNRTVAWNQLIYLNTVGGRYAVSVADAGTQLSSYATVTDGKITVTLPATYVLVYSVSDSTLKVVARESVAVDDVVLFGEYYQNDYGLIWDKYWRDYYIDNRASYASAIKATDIFNAEPYTGTYNWQTPVVDFGKLFKGTSKVEAFAFFTDAHLGGGGDTWRNETRQQNYLKRVQKVFNSTSCSFLVFGGDWLNDSATMDEACYRLSYLKGVSDHLLDGCKLVLGNHDTNYYGKLDANSENGTGRLSNETLASVMFRDTDTKKAYYSFDGANSKCYVLDTGIEHTTMLAYDWEQIEWLGKALKENDTEHAIIFLHIIKDGNYDPYIFPSTCGSLVQAYNSHTSITLNGISYDFSSCTGHVDFWVGGHYHTDSTGTLGGIPYFLTATSPNPWDSDVPVIDLVLADYDAGKVSLVRVGGGNNRVFDI